MRHPFQTLLYRLTVPILLGIVLLGATYAALWSQRFTQQQEVQFLEESQRAVSIFADLLATPLWSQRLIDAQDMLGALRDWPHFELAGIYNTVGPLAAYGVPDTISAPFSFDPAQIEDGQIMVDGTHYLFVAAISTPEHGTIGHLVASFDAAPIQTSVLQTWVQVMRTEMAGFVLLGLLLFWIARSVIQPLQSVTQTVEQVAAGELQLEIPMLKRQDEVGRLARALEVFRNNAGKLALVRAESEANRRVAERAMLDDLTQLSNRTALLPRAVQLCGAKPDTDFAVLHIDLDGIRPINDTLGHTAGDLVLQTVAKRLQRLQNGSGLIARTGGDEFVIVAEEAPGGPSAQDIAHQVLDALRVPIALGGQTLRFGAAIGIARHPAGTSDISQTLVQADIALNRAKATGSGTAIVFCAQHKNDVVRRKQLSDEIFQSLENGHFVPFFQPIVAAKTNRLVAVEMLARWNHPDRGVLPPSEFIEVATDLKIQPQIDRQILDSALASLGRLKTLGLTVPRLSVNVSAERLIEPDLTQALEDACASGLGIDVELLETICLEEVSGTALWQIDRLREMGIGVHIDDFGTGHASIAGLLKIAPDKLKIDRQFVGPTLESVRNADLVRTIVGIGNLLGISVVAEGIETPEHAALMRALGCSYLQGYAFARPLCAEALEALILKPPVGRAWFQGQTQPA